jgi:hypothetical protein
MFLDKPHSPFEGSNFKDPHISLKTQGTKMSAHKVFTWVLQSMFITPTLIEARNKEMGVGMGRKFSHFVDLKNMISAHAKDFCDKKMALSYI